MKRPWLLDQNVPVQLVEVLATKGIAAQTAFELGWHKLEDAELLRRASDSHEVLLTRDRRFGQTARSALGDNAIPVVVIQLPQMPQSRFVEMFQRAWDDQPLTPPWSGVIDWPHDPAGA